MSESHDVTSYSFRNENLHCIKSVNDGMIKTAVTRMKYTSKIFIFLKL